MKLGERKIVVVGPPHGCFPPPLKRETPLGNNLREQQSSKRVHNGHAAAYSDYPAVNWDV